MTSPRIRILRERVLTSTRSPGTVTRRIAITYSIGPRPPQVLFVPAEELPDWAWRNENPGAAEVPADVLAEGDVKRRELIEANEARVGEPAPRTI